MLWRRGIWVALRGWLVELAVACIILSGPGEEVDRKAVVVVQEKTILAMDGVVLPHWLEVLELMRGSMLRIC